MHLIYSDIVIRVGGYAVKTEFRDFYIPSERNYIIFLRNKTGNNCNYTITIDGIEIGTWRLAPYESINIDRPAYRAEKFFFIDKTLEPMLSDKNTGNMVVSEELCDPNFSAYDSEEIETDCVDGTVGATVLLGQSNQRFTAARYLESKLVAVFYFGMKVAKKWALL